MRVVTKYFIIKGLSPTDIKSLLDATLEKYAPSYTTVKMWVADYRRGHINTEDAKRSGRPKFAPTEEIVQNAYKIIINNRRLKLMDVAEIIGVSKKGRIIY